VPSTRAVAINAAVVGERPTGLGVFALSVIDALAELGERLTVYTSRPEAIETPGVDLRRAPAGARPERGVLGHLTRLAWGQLALRAGLRRARPDVLLHLMPEAVLGLGLPQVVTIHDLFPLRYPRDYPRLAWYLRYWMPLVVRACRAVVTISEASRREIVRVYGIEPGKVHVALCGYDRRRFMPDGPAAEGGEPYVLYVGNVMPHKNLLRMVEAFARLSGSRPARLRIRGWGRPAHVQALRERIAALGIGARVDWQPYAPAADLPQLYRGARVLVMPSLEEGFGLTALEAMACGTPVVASNTSSLPEVVGDAAVLVDPRDTAALAAALERVLGDDGLVRALRDRGLERARQFSWRRTGDAVRCALDAALAPAS
jgi:glycosyltransferase involved in cell wall biosynthesis